MDLESLKAKLVMFLPAGTHHYRAFVGPPKRYDLISAMQFNLLTLLGLREHHFLLDIGCGSLRAGKLFIPYLLPGRYFGVEPEQWLIDEGIKNELGQDIIRLKRPVFSNDRDFTFSAFGQKFDFLVAQSVFSHASQQQIRRCLSEVKRVMNPSSLFVANFLRGEENYTGDEWVYPGCVPYTLEQMSNLAAEQGLSCKLLEWPHAGSLTWVVIAHPETADQVASPDGTRRLRLETELRYYREALPTITKIALKLNRVPLRLKQWARGSR